jgi:hypothetical protein
MEQRAARKQPEKIMRKPLESVAHGALLLSLSISAEAQQAGKIFRIGYLESGTASDSAVLL